MPNQPGSHEAKSTFLFQARFPRFEKNAFSHMTILIQKEPFDNPVFQFLDKKRYEGKLYDVYITADCNKFFASSGELKHI